MTVSLSRDLRVVIFLHLGAVAVQAVSAGQFLSGYGWVTTHRVSAWAVVSIAGLQLVVSTRRARRERSGLGLAVSSAALLLTEALQIGTGYLKFFAAHVPIGVLIVGGLVWQLAATSRLATGCVSDVTTDVATVPAPAESLDSASGAVMCRLGTWARLAPALVLLQIGLGALYRLHVSGVLLHLAGAFAASLLVLSVATIVLQQLRLPAELRRAAMAAIASVLCQAAFGIVAFFMELLGAASSPAGLAASLGHAVVGAVALAASVVLAMRIRQYSRIAST